MLIVGETFRCECLFIVRLLCCLLQNCVHFVFWSMVYFSTRLLQSGRGSLFTSLHTWYHSLFVSWNYVRLFESLNSPDSISRYSRDLRFGSAVTFQLSRCRERWRGIYYRVTNQPIKDASNMKCWHHSALSVWVCIIKRHINHDGNSKSIIIGWCISEVPFSSWFLTEFILALNLLK